MSWATDLSSSVFKILNNYSVTLSVSNVTLCPSVWENACFSKMVVRKTKEDRSVRETKPVVLPVKQKESLSHMNSREFTYMLKTNTLDAYVWQMKIFR